MAGFAKDEKEEFGIRNAKSGEWYSYGLYGQGHAYGQFLKLDNHEPIAYFSRSIGEILNETGNESVIKEGEIAVSLPSITAFYPATLDDVKKVIAVRNWHRPYLGEWVSIVQPNMEPSIGKALQVFNGSFHLMPYLSNIGKRHLVETGKEKVVIFGSSPSIEAITKEAVDEYLKK